MDNACITGGLDDGCLMKILFRRFEKHPIEGAIAVRVDAVVNWQFYEIATQEVRI